MSASFVGRKLQVWRFLKFPAKEIKFLSCILRQSLCFAFPPSFVIMRGSDFCATGDCSNGSGLVRSAIYFYRLSVKFHRGGA